MLDYPSSRERSSMRKNVAQVFYAELPFQSGRGPI